MEEGKMTFNLKKVISIDKTEVVRFENKCKLRARNWKAQFYFKTVLGTDHWKSDGRGGEKTKKKIHERENAKKKIRAKEKLKKKKSCIRKVQPQALLY